MKKGLIIGILEPKGIGNCSNGGISEKCKSVTVLGVLKLDGTFVGLDPIFEPTNERPAVVIKERDLFVNDKPYLTAYPCDNEGNPKQGWYMFGGCHIYCSDTRFNRISRYPIPLHDRKES